MAREHPAAELTLLDGAAAMLEQARARIGDRARYVVADLADPLPAGPWDAIVSALAIHHLDDPAKRDLVARARGALAPRGVVVNAEPVAGALGAGDAEWAAAVARMSHDRCATVSEQLVWLRDAGFVDAGCLWRDGRFAVLVARAAA